MWWENFVSQTVVPEQWKENIRMSRPSSLKLSKELRPYIEGKSTRMSPHSGFARVSPGVSVDGRKRYENGIVDADQLMRFR